jgi:hypothetical protein
MDTPNMRPNVGEGIGGTAKLLTILGIWSHFVPQRTELALQSRKGVVYVKSETPSQSARRLILWGHPVALTIRSGRILSLSGFKYRKHVVVGSG